MQNNLNLIKKSRSIQDSNSPFTTILGNDDELREYGKVVADSLEHQNEMKSDILSLRNSLAHAIGMAAKNNDSRTVGELNSIAQTLTGIINRWK